MDAAQVWLEGRTLAGRELFGRKRHEAQVTAKRETKHKATPKAAMWFPLTKQYALRSKLSRGEVTCQPR